MKKSLLLLAFLFIPYTCFSMNLSLRSRISNRFNVFKQAFSRNNNVSLWAQEKKASNKDFLTTRRKIVFSPIFQRGFWGGLTTSLGVYGLYKKYYHKNHHSFDKNPHEQINKILQQDISFDIWYLDPINRKLLLELLDYDHSGVLAQLVLKNIVTIFRHEHPVKICKKLMVQFPQETLQAIVQFPIELLTDQESCLFIKKYIVNSSPEIKKAFINKFLTCFRYKDLAVETITQNNVLAHFFQKEIIEPHLNQLTIRLLDLNLSVEFLRAHTLPLLNLIMAINPNNCSKVIKTLIKNRQFFNITDEFFELFITHDHNNIIGELLFEELHRDMAFTSHQLAYNNFSQVVVEPQTNAKKIIFLMNYLKENSQHALLLIPSLLNNIEKVHWRVFMAVTSTIPHKKEIKKVLKRYNKKTNFLNIDAVIKTICFCKIYPEEHKLLSKLPQIPTIQHLIQLFFNNTEQTILSFEVIKPELIQSIASEVLKLEKQLKDDYYTFIHGQDNHYLLFETVYTLLQQNKKPGDFLYLHVKEFSNDAQIESRQRNLLLKFGPTSEETRQKLLFVNRAFFGNTTNLGSCSPLYLMQNRNIKQQELNWESLFTLSGNNHLYEKYKTRLEQLQKQLSEITSLGTCLLIAIPKKTAHKQIYLAHPGGGYKKRISLSTTMEEKIVEMDEMNYYQRITQIDNIDSLMENLSTTTHSNEDLDRLEFCIPMTADTYGGLNPESGIKIFPLNQYNKEENGNPLVRCVQNFLALDKVSKYQRALKSLLDDLEKDLTN